MAKKRQSGRLAIGTRVRVKPGVAVPELPDVACDGWTGVIERLIGKNKADPKYVVEWDAATIDNMPADYRQKCEENGLFFRMACFSAGEIEVVS